MLSELQPPQIDSKQRGAALLLALLVVALVTGIATNMTGEYLIDIKYQRNYLDEEQAYFYLLSAEAKAMQVLFADNEGDQIRRQSGIPSPLRDNLCENWLRPMQFAVPGGNVKIILQDENKKFNINRLIRDQSKPVGSSNFPYTSEQQIFVRLLQTFGHLEIELEEALEIAEAIYDWMDRDSETEGFGGMEDDDYSSDGFSYRTPNTGIASISELRLIPKVSSRLYRALRPHITVWPAYGRFGESSNYSAINVNTASINILRALSKTQGLVPLDAESMLEVRKEQSEQWITNSAGNIRNTNLSVVSSTREKAGYTASADCGFTSMSHFNAMVPGGADNPFINLHSNQILVETHVSLGDIKRKMQTVVHRIKSTGEMQVWARAFGSL